VPDVALSSKAQKEKTYSRSNLKGRHVRDLHRCMRVILNSVMVSLEATTAENGAIIIENFRLGKYCKRNVRLVCPLAVFIGDAKSQDAWVGRFGAYRKVANISRQCDMPHSRSDKFNQPCWYRTQDEVDNLNYKIASEYPIRDEHLEELRAMSRHRLPYNALSELITAQRLIALRNGEWEEVEQELAHTYVERFQIARDKLTRSTMNMNDDNNNRKRKRKGTAMAKRTEYPSMDQVVASMSFKDQEYMRLLFQRKRIMLDMDDGCTEDEPPDDITRSDTNTYRGWHKTKEGWERRCINIKPTNPNKPPRKGCPKDQSDIRKEGTTLARFDLCLQTPPGPFHAVLLGTVKRPNEVFLGDLTASSKAALDDILDEVIKPAYSQRTKTGLPRINFFRGITNTSNLTGKEWVGVCFAMTLCMLTTMGWRKFFDILTKRGAREKPKKRMPPAQGMMGTTQMKPTPSSSVRELMSQTKRMTAAMKTHRNTQWVMTFMKVTTKTTTQAWNLTLTGASLFYRGGKLS